MYVPLTRCIYLKSEGAERFKVKIWKKIYSANTALQKVSIATLKSEKADLKGKSIPRVTQTQLKIGKVHSTKICNNF